MWVNLHLVCICHDFQLKLVDLHEIIYVWGCEIITPRSELYYRSLVDPQNF